MSNGAKTQPWLNNGCFVPLPTIHKNLMSWSIFVLLGCIKDKRRAEKKDQLKEVASLCNSIGHIYAKYGKHRQTQRGGQTGQATKILHLSCRTSDLQFSLVLQTHALVLLKRMQ